MFVSYFRREVTCDKFGITFGERDLVLDYMSKMTYAKSGEEYEKVYENFKLCGLQPVIDYFDVNWNSIKDQWVEGHKGQAFSLGETTNNRLESINAKVKSVCIRYATLENFFTNFIAVLSVLRKDRTHQVLMALITKKVCHNPTEKEINEHLTPYASALVIQQFELRSKVKIEYVNDRGTVKSSAGDVCVSDISCRCKFFTTMALDCRHIFAVPEVDRLLMFIADLAAKRWTLKYLSEANSLKENRNFTSNVNINPVAQPGKSKTLSSNQKYRKAFALASELASLAAEVGIVEFEARLSTLPNLKDTWATQHDKVIVSPTEEQSCLETVVTLGRLQCPLNFLVYFFKG